MVVFSPLVFLHIIFSTISSPTLKITSHRFQATVFRSPDLYQVYLPNLLIYVWRILTKHCNIYIEYTGHTL